MLVDAVLQGGTEDVRDFFGSCRLRPGKSIYRGNREAVVEAKVVASNAPALVET